ncbi:MAG: hypothetical protein ACPG7F_15830, partial [Aggregatilineales bacterium]
MNQQKDAGASLTALAWQRFNVIVSVVSDTNARAIAVMFYFTFFMPFALISTIFSDPLNKKGDAIWLQRDPVSSDLEAA